MKHPLFDILGQDRGLSSEIRSAVLQVLDSGKFILGAEGETLEAELAALCGVAHGVGVGSGTDALILTLRAFGVGPGDEVITTPFSFGASAGSVVWIGATPVFADIDDKTMNLDPEAVRRAITPRTRAILPVHLFGLPAQMAELATIAKEHGLPLIEDAAQAIGGSLNRQPVGSLGDAACFSFYPTKNLGGYGDGGLVVTDSDEINERLRALRVHGSSQRYAYDGDGTNSRLDEIQAAVLRVKLRSLERWTETRRRHAADYRRILGECGSIQLPVEPDGARHVYHLYTLRVEDPDRLAAELGRRGIGTGRYYPTPLHLNPAFSDKGQRRGSFPVTEEVSRRCLSVPIHPALESAAISEIAAAIEEVLAASPRSRT